MSVVLRPLLVMGCLAARKWVCPGSILALQVVVLMLKRCASRLFDTF